VTGTKFGRVRLMGWTQKWSGPDPRCGWKSTPLRSTHRWNTFIDGFKGAMTPEIVPNNFQEKPSSAFRMQENPLVAGGAYSAPPDSLADGWKGASCPLTRTQRPLSAFCGHRSSLTRSTQPCIPPGSLNRVPASAGVKAGISPV